MLKRTSSILFYLVAAWCLIVGGINQTLTGVDDLPWVAKALEGSNVVAFNPLFAIWAHWIGMFLMIAGLVLILITPTVHESRRMLSAAAVLSIGTVGAQTYSVLSLGAFGPAVFALGTATVVAVSAPVVGWFGKKSCELPGLQGGQNVVVEKVGAIVPNEGPRKGAKVDQRCRSGECKEQDSPDAITPSGLERMARYRPHRWPVVDARHNFTRSSGPGRSRGRPLGPTPARPRSCHCRRAAERAARWSLQ